MQKGGPRSGPYGTPVRRLVCVVDPRDKTTSIAPRHRPGISASTTSGKRPRFFPAFASLSDSFSS